MNKPGQSAKLMVSYFTASRQINPLTASSLIGLTVQDVLTMSPKFWKLHADPISIRMGAAIVLIGSQYNLVVGTIAPYVKQQPSLTPLLQQLMDFDVS
jgi:hypothetical protein